MRRTLARLDVTLEQIYKRAQAIRCQHETLEAHAPLHSHGHQPGDHHVPELEFESLVSEFRSVWEQIKKHDEELEHRRQDLAHEVSRQTAELHKANRNLASAYAEMELFWSSIPSIVVGIEVNGCVTRWNAAATEAFGMNDSAATGRHIADCGIRWLQPDMRAEVSRWLQSGASHSYDNATYEKNGQVRVLGLKVRRMSTQQEGKIGFIITGADITTRHELEDQLRQAHKLEAIGQLAAGIAHEINTPTQFVSDNATFLKESWPSIAELLQTCKQSRQSEPSPDFSRHFEQLWQQSDLDYLLAEVPRAIDQCLDGLHRIAKIVRAMKEFSHPGSDEKTPVDINHAVETTVAVSRNEWKYVADVDLQLDESLPLVPCLHGEFNQAMLNLIVNAAQAIAGVVGDATSGKGKITIATRQLSNSVEISVTDTGTGIPAEIRSRIFEPFFTTKPVGKGTGQGLSLVHATVVKRLKGQLWFESEVGKGTTFLYVCLSNSHPPSRQAICETGELNEVESGQTGRHNFTGCGRMPRLAPL
jgi:PAS domain S-box-containing protein